ncbi:MAG: hypothetical protein JSS04_09115 [Proteobacteria bacterium]|nr:hypothetical protein [Pseudomonadota bacterium]
MAAPGRPGFPTGFVAVFLVTCLLFAITAATVADSRSSDAAGNAMSDAFAAMFAGALWIAVSVLLVMAAVGGAMVFWAPWTLFGLVPAALVAFFLAMGRFGEGDKSAMIVVIALPLLLILYAAWARFPALHGVLQPARTSAVLLSLVGVLSIGAIAVDWRAHVPTPQSRADYQESEQIRMEEAAKVDRREREREAAAFARLGPDSRLADYLPYLRDRAFADRALEGMQKVKTRQEDAVELLNRRPLADLTELWQWNVLATREVCEAYGNAFLAAANRITRARSDYLSAAMDLEWQMPNLKWILGSKCDLSGPLERAETNIEAVADSDRLRNFAITLGELKTVR